MKKAILHLSMFLAAGMLLSQAAYAQGIGINSTGANPHSSAGLDVDFNNKGLLPPRMTTTQRNAIGTPTAGLTIFNTTSGCVNIYNGTNWRELCPTVISATIASLDCAGATNNGTLTSGVAASSVNSVVSYTGGNGEAHSGQTVSSTGVTGLTATLSAGTFASGSGTLTYTITGTPSAAGTASFALNIGGQSCTLTRTVAEPPFVCGTSTVTFNSISYGTVARNYSNLASPHNSQGVKCWLDRNLGATHVASGSSDQNGIGHLFQWGRGNDGHQNRTSSTTTTLSTSDQPPAPDSEKFITTSNSPIDWRSPQNDILWQGVNGVNNPCPSGWRVPTQAEWNAERASWNSQNADGAFGSTLKLPMGGRRAASNGFFSNSPEASNQVQEGQYWSSSTASTQSGFLLFYNHSGGSAGFWSQNRANGLSVRCIKD